MRTLDAILLLVGFACFVAAFAIPARTARLVPLGLAAWILVLVIAAFQRVN